MHKSDSGSRRGAQKRIRRDQSDESTPDLLKAEEQILRGISARAPLPGVLNGICSALDCQIGNVVSLISLQGDDANELAAIVKSAESFGLHIFSSAAIVTQDGNLLGSLEIYCCVPRSPSAREMQLIDRANGLAVLAIKCDLEADLQAGGDLGENRSVRAHRFDPPVYLN